VCPLLYLDLPELVPGEVAGLQPNSTVSLPRPLRSRGFLSSSPSASQGGVGDSPGLGSATPDAHFSPGEEF
jgi:hypothetical protein